MTRRIQLLWKVLLAFFVTGAIACFVAWTVLLTSFCSNTRKPMPKIQHIISYNCHGMTVFISPLEDAMRFWLILVMVLFVFLSVLAAAMVVFSFVKVRIDVQIHHADGSSSSTHHESGPE